MKEGLVRLCAQLRSVVDEETISPSEAAAQFDDLVVRHTEYASVVAELSDQLQGFGEVDRLAKLSREANQIRQDRCIGIWFGQGLSGKNRIESRVVLYLDSPNSSVWLCSSLPWQLAAIKGCSCELSAAEMEHVSVALWRHAQQEIFAQEYSCLKRKRSVPSSSRLAPVYPWLDEDGLIRGNTQLAACEFIRWETKNPIVLQRKHDVTRLVSMNAHADCGLGGVGQALVGLCQEF